MNSSIIVEQLEKSYGTVKALQPVSFSVAPGELFGFIGPDGAGKTTLFRLLVTLLLPDAGTATLEGMDVVKDYKKIRQLIGYMPGRFSLYHDLTVEENLRFFATAFKTTVEENYDLVKDIYSHIEPFKKRLAGKLSGGMKQKLALSCALIHRPKILVLDEPTTGVDAVSRKEFWEMLKKLQLSGITIVVSTPYMDEAGLCDRVALMEKGRIMAVDTPAAITGRFAKKIYAVTSDHIYALSKEVNKFPATQSAWLFGQDLHVTGSENFSSDELLQYLAAKGFSEVKIRESEPVIEDCFLELMKDNTNE